MKTSEVLRAARAKIEVPERWTKRMFARDKERCRVVSWSTFAVCWCGQGANHAVVGPAGDWGDPDKALDEAVGGNFPDWQDDLQGTHVEAHAEVLAAFDKAIAEREAVGD